MQVFHLCIMCIFMFMHVPDTILYTLANELMVRAADFGTHLSSWVDSRDNFMIKTGLYQTWMGWDAYVI